MAPNFLDLQISDIFIVSCVAFTSTLLHCTNGRFTFLKLKCDYMITHFPSYPHKRLSHLSIANHGLDPKRSAGFLKRRDLYLVKFLNGLSLSSPSHSPTVTTTVAFLCGYCRFLAFFRFCRPFYFNKWNYVFKYKGNLEVHSDSFFK